MAAGESASVRRVAAAQAANTRDGLDDSLGFAAPRGLWCRVDAAAEPLEADELLRQEVGAACTASGVPLPPALHAAMSRAVWIDGSTTTTIDIRLDWPEHPGALIRDVACASVRPHADPLHVSFVPPCLHAGVLALMRELTPGRVVAMLQPSHPPDQLLLALWFALGAEDAWQPPALESPLLGVAAPPPRAQSRCVLMVLMHLALEIESSALAEVVCAAYRQVFDGEWSVTNRHRQAAIAVRHHPAGLASWGALLGVMTLDGAAADSTPPSQTLPSAWEGHATCSPDLQ